MTEFNPVNELREALLAEAACAAHGPLKVCASIEEGEFWYEVIQGCSPHNKHDHLRWFAKNDLWFLLMYILKVEETIPIFKHPWFFARCFEVNESPNGHLDFWSRGAGKSTIITYGKTIQDILCDPNTTIGIFSHTKPIAKRFLVQIKTTLENNEQLKQLFPEILYADPSKEAPRWSVDDGIVVKRTANPREATIEAWGLIDGQPTSSHYRIMVFDDVITEKAVTTPEMIEKVTSQWELSLNLTATDPITFRVAGTFYAIGDTYHEMVGRNFGKVRRRCIIEDGKSVLWSDEGLAQKKQSMSSRNWAMQILLDPTQADKERGFKAEWINHWKIKPNIKSLNKYIFVDPGGKGRASGSYTAMVVLGLGADKNIYILYIVKDRLSLLERAESLFQLHREYTPLNTYYERYSMQADIEHIKDRMDRETYRFPITEVGAEGVQLDKDIRIESLQPDFETGRILLPPLGTLKRKMHDGIERDLVANVIDREILPFPFGREKDFLDALARIHDPKVQLLYPRTYGSQEENDHWKRSNEHTGLSWMAD